MTILSDRHSDAGEKELDGVAPLLPFLLNVCNLERKNLLSLISFILTFISVSKRKRHCMLGWI